MQPIAVGETIATILTTYLRGIPKLLAIAVPFLSIPFVAGLLMPRDESAILGVRVEFLNRYLLGIVGGRFVTAALTFEVLQRLQGERVPIGRCLAIGVQRLSHVIAVSLLTWLAVLGGVICLIIPGLILHSMFAVTVPVCVEERTSILRSLARSVELTRGNRRRLIAVQLVIGFVAFSPLQALMLAVEERVITFEGARIVATGLQLGLSGFGNTLLAVASATTFHVLRENEEGPRRDRWVETFA